MKRNSIEIKQAFKDIETIYNYQSIKDELINEVINEIWVRFLMVIGTIILILAFISMGYFINSN